MQPPQPQDALTLEECYQPLADILVASLSDNWVTASISAEVADDWTDVLTTAVDAEGVQYGFRMHDREFLPMNASNILIRMRDLMKPEGNERWNRVEFTLTHGGQFNMRVEYPGS